MTMSLGPVSVALASAGLPTRVLALGMSFYTDPSYNLDRLGAAEFVGDPRFLVHGLTAILAPADQCGAAAPASFTTDPERLMKELRRVLGARLDGATVLAHDAQLAALVLARRFGLSPRHVLCTRFVAHGVNGGPVSPSDVDGVARRHDLARAALPPAPRGLRQLDVRQVEAVRRSTMAESELVLALARHLIPRLPGGAVELRVIDHTVRMIVGPGLRLDIEGAKKLLAEVKDLKGCSEPTASEGSLVQTAARLRRMIAVASLWNGTTPVQLEYYGAHTGRYSGAGGINLQNLPHRVSGPAAEIRGLLLPPDGRVLVVVDASQIEARLLAWLSGETELVSAFTAGRDIYSEFASDTLKTEVRKPVDTDNTTVARRMKGLRGVGKAAVLGLGYGMGASRFEEQLGATPNVAALFQSGELSSSRIVGLVRAYRERYPRIVALWAKYEDAFLAAANGKDKAPFFKRGTDVVAGLPSGREIVYASPRVERLGLTVRRVVLDDGTERDVQSTGERRIVLATGEETYGAKLVENYVQALARDILVGAVLRLDERGYAVALHVHDEVVLAVPPEEASAALEHAITELSRDPGWDPDRGSLPLRAEGKPMTTYGGDAHAAQEEDARKGEGARQEALPEGKDPRPQEEAPPSEAEGQGERAEDGVHGEPGRNAGVDGAGNEARRDEPCPPAGGLEEFPRASVGCGPEQPVRLERGGVDMATRRSGNDPSFISAFRQLTPLSLATLLATHVDPAWMAYSSYAVGPCLSGAGACRDYPRAAHAYPVCSGWAPWVRCTCGCGAVETLEDLLVDVLGSAHAGRGAIHEALAASVPPVMPTPREPSTPAERLEDLFPRTSVPITAPTEPFLGIVLDARRTVAHSSGRPMIVLDMGIRGFLGQGAAPLFLPSGLPVLYRNTMLVLAPEFANVPLERVELERLVGREATAQVKLEAGDYGSRMQVSYVEASRLRFYDGDEIRALLRATREMPLLTKAAKPVVMTAPMFPAPTAAAQSSRSPLESTAAAVSDKTATPAAVADATPSPNAPSRPGKKRAAKFEPGSTGDAVSEAFAALGGGTSVDW